MKKKLSEHIKAKALEFGFQSCGITGAGLLKEHEKTLRYWLEKEYHGEMQYMEKNIEKRVDPSRIIEKGKSVVVVLKSYHKAIDNRAKYKISKYAQGADYHNIVKEDLNKLLDFIKTEVGNVGGRCFVDSAPLLERALAQKAGLGWFGKNSMLLNKQLGSFFFIGEIVLDIDLAFDEPMAKDYCGNCTLCIDSCPTKAIVAPKIVDASRCISYLTIEKRGDFECEETDLLNGWIFGCDICQNVCPWNKKAKNNFDAAFFQFEKSLPQTRQEWLELTGNQFKQKYKSSPLQRAGLKQIKRNLFAND